MARSLPRQARIGRVALDSAAVVLCLPGAGVASSAPASAANCSQSWQKADGQGRPVYDCRGQGYALNKPWSSNSWNDPWTTYQLELQCGSGSKSQDCVWSLPELGSGMVSMIRRSGA